MSGSTQTNYNNDGRNNNNNDDESVVEEVNAQMELLMRHSSPIILSDNNNSSNGRGQQQQQQQPQEGGTTSPVLVSGGHGGGGGVERRNSTPSPLRMHRPRSNPRTRTPMRFESPLQQYRINEEGEVNEDNDNDEQRNNNEARRITILPMAGTAVGSTTIMTTRGLHGDNDGQQQRRGGRGPVVGKSRKQGPSHRKVRRWNNDNFVNLAAEINNAKASEVLLKGHANASKYRSIYEPKTSKSMSELHKNKMLSDKFYDGTLIVPQPISRSHNKQNNVEVLEGQPLTPTTMLNRIDSRLRRVIVKACTNSFAASKVVNMLETFLFRVYVKGKTHYDKSTTTRKEWNDIRLLEPPTATYQKSTQSYITKFVFDSNAPTGGFHRLLLHGLCQFHGLKAMSSTMEISIYDSGRSSSNEDGGVVVVDDTTTQTQNARLLTATGTFSGSDYKLVDCISKEYGGGDDDDGDRIEDRHVVITTTTSSSLSSS